jgi:hypothetical protein
VTERRAEELRSHTRCGLDGVLCTDDLVADAPGHAEGVQAIVAVTVYADGVAAGVNGAHDGGTATHLLAQHEERDPVATPSGPARGTDRGPGSPAARDCFSRDGRWYCRDGN